MSNRSCRTLRHSILIAALTLLSSARPAAASPLQELIGDTASPAAMQARTLPGGSAAAYFNPALLIDTPSTSLSAGIFVLKQGIGVSLMGRPGTQYALPDNVDMLRHANGDRFDNYGAPTRLLQYGRMETPGKGDAFTARPRQGAGSGDDTTSYMTVGIVVKAFKDRLAIGFHGMIPNGQFTRMRAFFNDEREQYFSNSLHPELYSDRMRALTMGLGLGLKITDALSIGAGTTFALKAGADAGAYVADAGQLGNIQLDMDAPVNIGISPHFGLSWKATPRLRLTATAHTPQKVEFSSNFKFLVVGGTEAGSTMTFVLSYNPWRISAGAAYDLVSDPSQTLTVAMNILYGAWSSYIDRHGERPSPAYAWADTISPTVGLRYKLANISTTVDLGYVPTPVPLQTGRTNYVDNDRVTGSLGAQYEFIAFDVPLTVGVLAQIHRLVPRKQVKLATPTRPDGSVVAPERVKDEVPDDASRAGNAVAGAEGLQTNNPGWPGYSSGGWILGGTVYLSIAL